MIYIFWTTKTSVEAQKLIQALLEKKWIACASILPNVQSFYYWEGALQSESEVKVIFKTMIGFFEKIERYLQENGSYEISEITQISIDQVSKNYFNWVKGAVS